MENEGEKIRWLCKGRRVVQQELEWMCGKVREKYEDKRKGERKMKRWRKGGRKGKER